MILSKGKNDFINNCFDKYRWSANTYETSEEIFSYLQDLGVCGKTIKKLSAIGAVWRLSDWKSAAIDTLIDAGIISDYVKNGTENAFLFFDGSIRAEDACLDLLNNVTISRDLCLDEPLLIQFEDDSVLELLPHAPKGLRIGYNTLPKNMKDGTNHNNFEIDTISGPCIVGNKLGFPVVASNVKTISYSGPYRDDRIIKRNQYRFSAFTLQEYGCGEFLVSFTCPDDMKYGDLSGLDFGPKQQLILDGRLGAGSVSVYPTNAKDLASAYDYDDNPDVFSVMYLPDLFHPLLKKHFDPDLTANIDFSAEQYDDNHMNYYTKEMIIEMVREAESVFEQTLISSDNELDVENDFAYRFLARLNGLAKDAAEYEYICFKGP